MHENKNTPLWHYLFYQKNKTESQPEQEILDISWHGMQIGTLYISIDF